MMNITIRSRPSSLLSEGPCTPLFLLNSRPMPAPMQRNQIFQRSPLGQRGARDFLFGPFHLIPAHRLLL